MIQVSSRSANGSIKKFRVHDLFRDLAMKEAAKENFMTVLPKTKGCNDYPDKGIGPRRVSVQSTDYNELIQHIGPHTRSFFWFYEESTKEELKLKSMKKLFDKCRLLRVVETLGSSEIELAGVDRLIHLKYLSSKSKTRLIFPDGCRLGRLKNLETISLESNWELDDMQADVIGGLWTIGTLRHALFNWISSPCLPPPHVHVDLKNLQSLLWVSVKKQDQLILDPNHSSCLSKLRKLGLVVKDENCWDRVGHLLGTLPSLVTLRIVAPLTYNLKLPAEIVYPRTLPNYENLQTLHLAGEWRDQVPALKAELLPPHLLSLTLAHSKLASDPMPELGMLKSLRKLVLRGEVYSGGNEMICPSGFPLLQTLVLSISNVKSFTVVEGVMLNLKSLTYRSGRTRLQLPPALKQLPRRI